MDIWQWYQQYERDMWESGQDYPVRLVDDFLESVVHMQYGKAEALLPEVRALKQSANNPWLEVLLGHWEMRHRLGNEAEGQTALADVVALYERAHQSDTAECPQSVCVTQDLSHCYCNVDARGWADERIAVCQETMAGIDPSWSCYQCLSDEQFDAMLDKGLYEEALIFVREQIEKIKAAGADEDDEALRESEAEALMLLGQYDEALAIMDRLCESSNVGGGSTQARETQNIIRLQVLAHAGRDEEAWEALPAITPHIAMRWVDVFSTLLARAPEKNTWQVGRSLQQILEQRIRVGAPRDAITVAKTHITLALARGATWTARQTLALAKTQLPKLRSALGDDQALEALEEQLNAQAQQVTLPVPADQLMDWLNERDDSARDPEQEVEWLMLALAERPDDHPLRQLTASALQACAASDHAIEVLQSRIEQYPAEESEIPYQLLQLLLQNRRFNQIQRLADIYEEPLPNMACWYRIHAAQAQEDWEKAEHLCSVLLQLPGHEQKIMPYIIAGAAAMKLKAFERALQHYLKALALIDQQQEISPNNTIWDAITAASALQDWAQVRALAARLDMTFSTEEGPIEENGGWIRLRFWEDNEYRFYLAQRTGPSTAIVRQPNTRDAPQHLHDKVVFEPTLLNEAPQTEEEQQNFIGLYDTVHIMEEGGYAPAWFLDGAAPAPETFQQFVDQLEAEGCYVWITSDNDYQVVDTQTDDAVLPGVYFLLSSPKGMAPQTLDALLTRLTSDWPHQPHWLGLARAAGVDETRHTAIIERYQL